MRSSAVFQYQLNSNFSCMPIRELRCTTHAQPIRQSPSSRIAQSQPIDFINGFARRALRCQTPPMISRFASHTRWIWLLCIVLLAVRMSGAHLHLCFDGAEPPFAIHAGDIAGHDDFLGEHGFGNDNYAENHADIQHSDTDLSLVDDGLAKTIKLSLFAPALLAALLVLCLRIITRAVPASIYSPPLFRFIPSRFSAPRAPPR
jgi:hypothetical protein